MDHGIEAMAQNSSYRMPSKLNGDPYVTHPYICGKPRGPGSVTDIVNLRKVDDYCARGCSCSGALGIESG